MPRLLDVDGIKSALTALARELQHEQQSGELLVVGGAALALLYNARQTTKDVDVYILLPEKAAILRSAARRVAADLDLPEDWLNDGAKGYVYGLALGATVFEAEALRVRALAPAQLLAMKLTAWRGEVDICDARLLLGKLTGSAQEIWAAVEPHLVPDRADRAWYAFQDLWESSRVDPAG